MRKRQALWTRGAIHGSSTPGICPCRVGYPTDAVPVVEILCLTIDLVDMTRLDGTDDMQAIADLLAAGHGEIPVRAVALFGDTGRYAGFKTFKLAVEHEVDHAC